jgi:hypothetical protein
MKIYGKFLLIFCFAIQFSCSKRVEKYDLNPFLDSRVLLAKKSPQLIRLELCDQTPFKWDKIIILKPYSNDRDIKKYNLTNGKAVESMLPALTVADWMCVLLFVENNTVVRYSDVNFASLDFTKIEGLDKMNFTLGKRMACEQLYIKNDNNNFSLSY